MIRRFSGSWHRAVALTVLLGFLPLAGGCFGSFNLTRKVYQFNKSVSPDKWLRWLMFLALNILPVYPFASLVDIFFANAWEFWAGDNPVTASLEPQTVVGPNGEVASLIPVANGARIVVTEPSGAVHSTTLLREGHGAVAAYDDQGHLVARLVGLGTDEPRLVDLAAAH
jgi:hypothetical protein